VREIQDDNSAKYFIIELENKRLTHRYLMVSEKCVGDSIPREFSQGEGPLHVGIAVVLNDRIVANDTFDFDEVHYFAIGEIRPIR